MQPIEIQPIEMAEVALRSRRVVVASNQGECASGYGVDAYYGAPLDIITSRQ